MPFSHHNEKSRAEQIEDRRWLDGQEALKELSQLKEALRAAFPHLKGPITPEAIAQLAHDAEQERPPVNLDSLRWLGTKFREWEAPYKEKGDWHGLWLGASATLIERAADEIAAARGAASAPTPHRAGMKT